MKCIIIKMTKCHDNKQSTRIETHTTYQPCVQKHLCIQICIPKLPTAAEISPKPTKTIEFCTHRSEIPAKVRKNDEEMRQWALKALASRSTTAPRAAQFHRGSTPEAAPPGRSRNTSRAPHGYIVTEQTLNKWERFEHTHKTRKCEGAHRETDYQKLPTKTITW
jgi:hypothetical protein